MVGARRHHPCFEDFKAQFLAERAHFHHQAAGETGANAIIEAFQVRWRAIGGDHHLSARVDQRVERVTEFGLGRLTLQELQVVDHQDADTTERFLEGESGLRAERRYKAVHELLGREVEYLALACCISRPGDSLQKVRLAEADAGMNIQRIEHHGVAALRARDLFRRGMRERIRAADDEKVEGQAWVKR